MLGALHLVSSRKSRQLGILSILAFPYNPTPQATYLQKAGLDTLVLEKRHVLGGAAVTEEMVPGKFTCYTCTAVPGKFTCMLHLLDLHKVHGQSFLF